MKFRNLIYCVTMILSTTKRTCESMAKIANKSGDYMLRTIGDDLIPPGVYVLLAKQFFGNRPLYLIIDDTLISKIYSQKIEGTSDNYDSSRRQICRSLCIVVAMVTDGKRALPIKFSTWIKKEMTDDYKTKSELALEIIMKVKKHLDINSVIMDGLYATQKNMLFFIKNKINFEMRFHSNRRIKPESKDITFSVKEYFLTKLNGKKKKRTIKAYWHGMFLFVTGLKRQMKNGEYSTVFQVSNCCIKARDHVKLYSYRWNIEKFFRTSKQHLGLNDCSSRKLAIQKNHIKHVFLSYISLQFEQKEKHFKNPEAAIKRFKNKNFNELINYLSCPRQIFGVVYA